MVFWVAEACPGCLGRHFCRYLRDRRGFLGLKLVTVRGSRRSFVPLESLNSRQYVIIATFLFFAVSSCAIFCCYLLYRLRLSGSRALFFVAICVTGGILCAIFVSIYVTGGLSGAIVVAICVTRGLLRL